MLRNKLEGTQDGINSGVNILTLDFDLKQSAEQRFKKLFSSSTHTSRLYCFHFWNHLALSDEWQTACIEWSQNRKLTCDGKDCRFVNECHT